MKIFSTIFSVVLICGLIAFTTYQIVQVVRTIKERKKAKSIKVEEDK